MCRLTETRALSAQGEKRALVGNLTMPLYPYRISQPVSKTWRPRLSSEPGTAEVYFWVKEMTDRSQPAVDHFREGADLQPDGFSVPSYS